jgi:hypothetical protein
MSDVNVSFLIDCESTRMRLNRKRAEKLSLGSKLLDSLVPKLGGVYLVALADRDAHARVELTLSFSTASPLQEEPRSRYFFVIRRARNA